MKTTVVHTGETPWGAAPGSVTLPKDARMSSAEALDFAGLNFEVQKAGVFVLGDSGLFDGPPHGNRVVPGKCAIVRADTGDPIAVVGKDYGIVQNSEAFSLLDIAAGEGGARISTVGIVDGGKRVFALADMPEGEWALAHGEDHYRMQLMLTTAHDGTQSVTWRVVCVRLWCMNQLAALLGGMYDRSPVIRIPHTRKVTQRIADVKKVLNRFALYSTHIRGTAIDLSSVHMSASRAVEMADELFPESTKATAVGPRERFPQINRQVSAIFAEQNQRDPMVANTRWGFYNAVTAYLDHNRRGTPRTRLNRAVSGTDDALRGRVLTALAA